MKRRNFTELTFKEIVDSILKESAEEIDDFAAESEDTDTEDSMEDDEFDVEDFEEDANEETEGDVTLTLTLEEVSVLRSIMAKIDAVSEEETTEDDVEEPEGDDVEISEEDADEEPADIPVPEEEETVLGSGQGDRVVTLSNKGVSRKKGAPAIDRSRAKKDGLMGSAKAAGDADVVELGNVGASRRKETPAVTRSHKVSGTRIAPGKATIEIGK